VSEQKQQVRLPAAFRDVAMYPGNRARDIVAAAGHGAAGNNR
jgi:hypothetical protein